MSCLGEPVPRDRWDRKSLDEGAHYEGERWEEVRAAENHATGYMYQV